MKLSGVVITYNEESNIERCLTSLSFCDEIIVLDSGSDDRTRDLAAQYTKQVYESQWKGYATQKNDAIERAQGEWIISVDADEEVSGELKEEILERINKDPRENSFSIPRMTMHSGRWIRYGGWYPNRLVRLFRKSRGQWVGGGVHERWESHGPIGELSKNIVHYSFKSISDQVERNDRYSSLAAKDLFKSGKSFSLSRLLAKPLSKFLETYLLKKGFLDGYPGFIISVSAAYSVFLKWAKLWELEKRAKKETE